MSATDHGTYPDARIKKLPDDWKCVSCPGGQIAQRTPVWAIVWAVLLLPPSFGLGMLGLLSRPSAIGWSLSLGLLGLLIPLLAHEPRCTVCRQRYTERQDAVSLLGPLLFAAVAFGLLAWSACAT